jgi:hypothetical protein
MKDRKTSRPGTTRMAKNEMGPARRNATLGREVQAKIGDQLRAIYDDVVSQGVPDRFADLLKKLEQDDGKRS